MMVTKISFSTLMLAIGFGLLSGSTHAQSTNDSERYEFYADRVYDKQTYIEWMRCSIGQQWSAEKRACLGKPKVFTFLAAQKLQGYEWRVPSPLELSTLIRTQPPGSSLLKIDSLAFPDMDISRPTYWTNEWAGDANAWFVDFSSGAINYSRGDYDVLNQKYCVRLMRRNSIKGTVAGERR